jgi:IMP dehydrogenase
MGEKIAGDTFTFDDVLIRPARSSIEPREASLRAVFSSGVELETPFLSAAMDRVTEDQLAIALYRAGGMSVLHRNCTIAAQVNMAKRVRRAGAKVAAACGPFDLLRAQALAEAKVDALVIDCAHGHNTKVITAARTIKKQFPPLPLIVGNIATAQAVRDLRGIADAVKVGVGPGSICTTRVVSGVGVPQLSAILEVAPVAHTAGMKVIADGGMRTSSDIIKALAAGADTVMLGNIFAGTEETPGKIILLQGKRYKEYRGMGSESVLRGKLSSDRYLISGRKAVPEGVEGLVPYKGPVRAIVDTLSSSVQIAMGYVGARTLMEFQKKAQFIRISPASLTESRAHTITEINS